VCYQVLTPQQWADREFGSVQLKDRRLARRVVKVASAMAADPDGSIPKQNKQWGQTKGAYRLFDHPRTTLDSLCHPHWQQTRLECDASGVVLLIQDTTWLDYTSHPQTEGLGWFGRSAKTDATIGNGLFLHSVLAVAPKEDGNARVIGLAWAKLYARTGEPLRGDQQKRSRRRRSPDRESRRWIEAVGQIGGSSPACRWIHVGDRESDIYELYEQANQFNVGFVIRLRQDRNVTLGHDTPDRQKTADRIGSSLKDVCRQMPTLGSKQLWINPKPGHAGRWASLSVSAAAVTIWSPQLNRAGKALRCWAVRAWEPNPPDGAEPTGGEPVEPIEWMLLSSEPIHDPADALRILGYYSCRWLIEEYHRCLKSGCKVEQRQLEKAERLEPLIGMLSVLAVRLLQLKNNARLTPDKPAVQCVPAELVHTLARLIQEDDPAGITVRRFTHEVAQRGGFMGRVSDGDPGWLTLWRGWHELMLIHAGYELAMAERRCG
jgi:hypothetical protein